MRNGEKVAPVIAEKHFERDLVHSDVVRAYQRQVSRQFGHPVTLADTEGLAKGILGTEESRIENLRQKYTTRRLIDLRQLRALY